MSGLWDCRLVWHVKACEMSSADWILSDSRWTQEQSQSRAEEPDWPEHTERSAASAGRGPLHQRWGTNTFLLNRTTVSSMLDIDPKLVQKRWMSLRLGSWVSVCVRSTRAQKPVESGLHFNSSELCVNYTIYCTSRLLQSHNTDLIIIMNIRLDFILYYVVYYIQLHFILYVLLYSILYYVKLYFIF